MTPLNDVEDVDLLKSIMVQRDEVVDRIIINRLKNVWPDTPNLFHLSCKCGVEIPQFQNLLRSRADKLCEQKIISRALGRYQCYCYVPTLLETPVLDIKYQPVDVSTIAHIVEYQITTREDITTVERLLFNLGNCPAQTINVYVSMGDYTTKPNPLQLGTIKEGKIFDVNRSYWKFYSDRVVLDITGKLTNDIMKIIIYTGEKLEE